MRNRVFERQSEIRHHLEQCLIDHWVELIELNSDRDDTINDLTQMVVGYIETMLLDQLEDDNDYLDLPAYEE